MTSSLERRSRGQHKRKTGDNKKKTPTPITSDSPSTSPPPNYAPFTPINPMLRYEALFTGNLEPIVIKTL